MNLKKATLLRKAGNYFLFGNIFISVCAFCLFWTTCLLIYAPLPLRLGIWVALATFFLYNFDSLLPAKLRYPAELTPRKAWVLAHWQVLAIAVVITGLLLIFLSWQSFILDHFWLLTHLAVISLFYSLPVIPTAAGLMPLRNVPLLKLFLIAYVWASVTVWLPLLAANVPVLTGQGWLLFAERFFFILPLTIIFDIRDVTRDRTTATITLPQLIGVKQAKLLALAFLVGYVILVFLGQEGTNRTALLLSGVVYTGIIALTHEKRSEYFYTILGDGVLILPLLFLLLL